MRKSWTSHLSSISYGLFVYGLGALFLGFMVVPVLISLSMSFTSGQTLKFPPPGLSLRWYAALLDPVQSEIVQQAAWNTLQIAVFAVLASLVFAVPAAFGMARISARRANALEPLFLAPMVLPSLVYGLALLIAANLMHISPSIWLVVLANVVVFGPLMFRATSSIAQQLDPSLEDASSLLGASRWSTFRRVTLPLLAPGIYAGMFLVFIQSIENVSLPLFLAPAGTTILPLEMFAMLQDSLDPRIAAISGVLIAITVLVLVAVQRLTPFLRDQGRS
ncbi:putative spermidine/putrescine transport system permease protein [Kaistia soli DSM 19436]|uniref:Putative spermidine/putrescine transport system permease protein n=1 Tax=Kaistia soli DSM 19436 TaxID=1122133 RepID=A0A1M5PF54_9HYPH|nr:ABC transporter permease [Kaistia soli]SHH00392.1 putative spermidine/putrescine transport system permease protein [Kaistia soli DSM 19436]